LKNSFVVPVEVVADCMQDELDFRNNSGTKYVFETNTICGFWLKLSDSYSVCWKRSPQKVASLPQYIFMNLDSLPFCTWKQKIETDSTLL